MKTTHYTLLLLICLLANTSYAQLPWTEDFSSYTNGSGIDGNGNLGDYPGGISQWSLDVTGATLSGTGDYVKTDGGALEVQDSDGPVIWTSSSIDISGCTSVSFTIDVSETGDHEGADYADVEYSVNGGAFTLITDWNGNGSATHTLIGDTPNDGDWVSETITQSGLSGTSLVLRVTMANNAGSEQMQIDNIAVTGTGCGAPTNTITTGTVNSAPFSVACNAGTDDTGTVDFTSTGTFNGGNIYTAQLSDATGSFASPTVIGTLTSTANSGSIPITLPSTLTTGTGYLIQIIASDPSTTGSNSAAFTITQTDACVPSVASGLMINEWSNGASGNQEYYEFVVAGECGATVDIRGYILDDNNGTFTTPASYSGTSSGIAPGHFRFTNSAQWGNIPVGSIIVIYNADDPNASLPADDPNDADNDSLYVVPHTSTLFERCTTMPLSSSPDSIYTPCAYATAPLTGWGGLSLRNSGDAIQVRNPDGSYYHGVSYGGSEISGGPHNLKLFNGSGSGMAGWFNDGDLFDVANWSSGSVAGNQTPGASNNAVNQAWLELMRDPTTPNCPITVLPVEISAFFGEKEIAGNMLTWYTESERNSDYFAIERSTDGKNWEIIGTVESAGDSQTSLKYQFVDQTYENVINYYRLKQVDNDGQFKRHFKTVTLDNRENTAVTLEGVYNLLGQPIDLDYRGVQIHVYSDGSSKKVVTR